MWTRPPACRYYLHTMAIDRRTLMIKRRLGVGPTWKMFEGLSKPR